MPCRENFWRKWAKIRMQTWLVFYLFRSISQLNHYIIFKLHFSIKHKFNLRQKHLFKFTSFNICSVQICWYKIIMIWFNFTCLLLQIKYEWIYLVCWKSSMVDYMMNRIGRCTNCWKKAQKKKNRNKKQHNIKTHSLNNTNSNRKI